MKATRALRMMVKNSGLTAIEISRRIGRTDNYLSSLLNRGSVPSVETFASIAEACGCRLCLVMPEQTVQLDGWEVELTTDVMIDGEKPGRQMGRE